MDTFFESSIEDLYKSAVSAFPNTTKRQHATDTVTIEHLRYLPFLGVKTLFIKGEISNEGRYYETIILFKKVDYTLNETSIIDDVGKKYTLGKLSLENTDVTLRCNCKDFYWRFNYYNHLDKSLYGIKRKKYESAGGPPANPKQMPGMCKHLMKTTNVLQEIGLIS